MSETDDEKKGFRVSDRRAFTSDGDLRGDEDPTPVTDKQETIEPPAPEKEEEAPSTRTEPVGNAQEDSGTQASPGPPPEVGFMDLVNMLLKNILKALKERSREYKMN